MSIHDPLFYNWSTFMRKNFMSHKEIVEFRGMDSAELGALFFRVGVAKGAQLFYLLLRSFEIADRVARAFWGYSKAIENNDEYNAKEEYAEGVRALNEYSPGNCQPYRGDIQFALDFMMSVFNEVSGKMTPEAEEIMYQRIASLTEILEKRGGPMEKPDVQRIANGMARNVRDLYPCIDDGEGTMHIERTDDMLALCSKPTPKGKRATAPPTCPNCLRISGLFPS